MAQVLFKLGLSLERNDFSGIADRMLDQVIPMFREYPPSFSNWASLLLYRIYDFQVIAVTGEDYHQKIKPLKEFYFPGKMFFASAEKSDLPYLEDRLVEGKTMLYLCTGKNCRLPSEDPAEVISLLKTF